MRWVMLAVFFLGLIYSVLSTEPDDAQPYLRVMARSSVYNAGEKKAIYCKGLNLKEKIEWLSPSGEIIEGRSTKNTRVFVERPKNETLVSSLIPLIIQSTQIKDSGLWTCKSGDLNETIDILVGEKVIIRDRDQRLEEEERNSAKMDCEAKGNPPPVVHWYKDTTLLVEKPLGLSEEIPIAQPLHQEFQTHVKLLKNRVKPPVQLISPSHELSLVFTAQEQRADHKKYVIKKMGDNYQLEIKNLSHADAGDYVCKVTQESLSYYTYKRVQLTVIHEPVLINTFTQEIYTTKYIVEEVYAILNETKNITCGAIANPPPSFRWNRRHKGYDREVIEKEGNIYTSEDGLYSVLMLRLYNESYLGEYKCTATNTKGTVSIVFHVTLGNRPEAPDFVALVGANTTDLVFNVTCSRCNMDVESDKAPSPDNLRVLGYSFQFVPIQEESPIPDWENVKEINVDITNSNDTLFVVGPLSNSTTFHARVRTRNAAGYSEWVPITPDPATTDHAYRLAASIVLLITAYMFTICY